MGIDVVKDVLPESTNDVGFQVGDVYQTGFAAREFDVVHAHQVLQHLGDPLAALVEMKRVSSGVVACREVDYESWLFYPKLKGMDKWKHAYREVCRKNGADPDIGRRMNDVFIKAGFKAEALRTTCHAVAYTGADNTKAFGETWAARVAKTKLATQMIKYGLATQSDVDEMAHDWVEWGRRPGALLFYVDVAVVARV